MPNWKELYSYGFMSAMNLYVNGDFNRLGRQLEVLDALVYDDEAIKKLEEFKKQLEVKYTDAITAVDRKASALTDSPHKREAYMAIDSVEIWKLTEHMKFHQRIAKDYAMLPTPGRQETTGG